MSIIIAYKRKDTIYMGTDTRVLVAGEKTNELCESGLKIQKLDNGILLGVTGENQERQTIIAYSDIFTLDKKGELTKKHIIKEIIPKLYNMLVKEKLLRVDEDDGIPYMRSMLLLAYRATLYEICSNFLVLKYEDFQVVGLCNNRAQQILLNAKENDNVNDTILKALKYSAKYYYTIGAPYVLIDTKDLKYTIVEGNN